MTKVTKRKKAAVLAPQFGIRRAPKTRYLYVEARGWFSTPSTTGNRAEGTLDGPISFDSVIVRAESDAKAYQFGAALMQTRREDDPTAGFNHATGTFLNDYVVKL